MADRVASFEETKLKLSLKVSKGEPPEKSVELILLVDGEAHSKHTSSSASPSSWRWAPTTVLPPRTSCSFQQDKPIKAPPKVAKDKTAQVVLQRPEPVKIRAAFPWKVKAEDAIESARGRKLTVELEKILLFLFVDSYNEIKVEMVEEPVGAIAVSSGPAGAWIDGNQIKPGLSARRASRRMRWTRVS